MTDQDAKAALARADSMIEAYCFTDTQYPDKPEPEPEQRLQAWASRQEWAELRAALATALGWAKHVEELRAALREAEAGLEFALSHHDGSVGRFVSAPRMALNAVRAALAQPEAGEGEKP